MRTERKLADEINAVIEDVKDRTTKSLARVHPLNFALPAQDGRQNVLVCAKLPGTKVAKKL